MEDKTFMALLVRELFQTEESAWRHGRVTAEQLGDIPPAKVLLQVSEQAGQMMRQLPDLVSKVALPKSRTGMAIGKAFSILRNRLGDVPLNKEKTFRATLLGMRHGQDLVVLLRHTARASGKKELADWCSEWLRERKLLIEVAASQLSWFAKHPDQAMAPAKQGLISRSANRLMLWTARSRQRIREETAGAAA